MQRATGGRDTEEVENESNALESTVLETLDLNEDNGEEAKGAIPSMLFLIHFLLLSLFHPMDGIGIAQRGEKVKDW